MRAMKDSGIKWIGEIPEEWEVCFIKQIMRNKSIKGFPDEEVLSLYRDYGIVPKNSRNDNHNVTSDDTSSYKLVDCDDFVINKMKAWQGSMALSKYRGIISPAYYVCSFIKDNISKKYVHYLLRNESYKTEYLRLSTGLRVGQWDLNINDFLRIKMVLPPLSEQQRIATYLDTKCGEIEELIGIQEKFIEELKSYKQSVITEAVTKGLNPNAKMKDSGVEWIGEIPEDWCLRNIKNLCSFINGDRSANYPSAEEFTNEGIPFCGADSLNNIEVDLQNVRFISEDKYNSMGGLKIQIGDILYTLRGSTIGKNAIANFDKGTVASSLMGIRPKSIVDNLFLVFWLNSQHEIFQRNLCINGSTAPNLSAANVGEFKIALPPLSEQHLIATYLDNKCSQIDSLITLKQTKIDELKSFKKSLIYEYVTGKKTVPETV